MVQVRTLIAAAAATLIGGAVAVVPSAAHADEPATLTAITVNAAAHIVPVPLHDQFTATGQYSDGTTQDLTATAAWSSSNSASITINASGLGTAVAPGSAAIVATVGSVTAFTTVSITSPSLVAITVTPASPTIAKGTTVQEIATGTYTDDSTVNLTSSVTWSSSNPAVAVISNTAGSTGLVTGVGSGAATITAVLGAVSNQAVLAVTAAALVSIRIAPSNPTIAAGTTLSLVAVGTFSDGSTQPLTVGVNWSSSNPSTAVVDSFGLVRGLSSGTTTISAAVGSVLASTSVTVTAPFVVTLSVGPTDPRMPANPSIPAGNGIQFQALALYSDTSIADLTSTAVWSSSNPSVATISSGSSGNGGFAIAHSPGTTTITASAGGVSSSATLTVTAATLASITILPATSFTLPAGGTQQLVALGTFSDGSSRDITSSLTWSSSSNAVAVFGQPGVVHALSTGTVTLTATDPAMSTIATATLTVTAPVLLSMHVTPTSVSLATGAKQQFVATGTYSDGSTQDLTASSTWTSSSPTAATVTSAGLATAVGTGSTTITATFGGASSSAQLSVTGVQLTSIVVSPVNRSVAVGGTARFTAIGHYSDGSSHDITASSVWSSSTPTVATVDATGVAKALSAGLTTISATSGGVIGAGVLTVTGVKLGSITVAPTSPSVAAGAKKQFTATGHYSDGTKQDLTASVIWTSSQPGVATIDANGLATTTSAGTVTISATSGAVTGTATLTVTAVKLLSIVVTPARPSVAAGATRQFTATGHYSDGTTQDVSAAATWASSDPGTATIAPGGLATSVHAGASTITATVATITGSATLTVTGPKLMSIAVTPLNRTLAVGAGKAFTATAHYSDGTHVDVTSQVTWSSSTPSVASIDAGGLVVAVSAGTATITATLDTISGSTTVTVTPT